MKSKILLSLMLPALLAGAGIAHAEDGSITFTGTISDSTCTISSDSRAIDVDFGDISTAIAGNAASVKKVLISI